MARPVINLFGNPNQNDALERIIEQMVQNGIKDYNEKLELFLIDKFPEKFAAAAIKKGWLHDPNVLSWHDHTFDNSIGQKINEAIDLLRRNGFEVKKRGDGGAW